MKKTIDLRLMGMRIKVDINIGYLSTKLGGKNRHKPWTVSNLDELNSRKK